MNYEHERRIKRFTRETPAFHRMGWEGRTVLWHLELKADFFGRIWVKEGDESRDLAALVGLPAELFRVGLDRLFCEDEVRWESAPHKVLQRDEALRGIAECESGCLLLVEFEERQKAKRSDALVAWEARERKRQAQFIVETHTAAAKATKGPSQTVSAERARAAGLINRAAAAGILGVSIPTLRRRFEGHKLEIYRSELGEYLFKPEQVHGLAAELVKALAPPPEPKRDPPAEPLEDPVWRERGARLAEAIGNKSYSTNEMYAIGKRIGMPERLIGDALAAAEGEELVKTNGRWSAATPRKDDKS